MSNIERKNSNLAFCIKCGAFLQEAVIAQSEQICPGCGRNMVVSIKNGKVVVFESERKGEAEPDYKLKAREMSYFSYLSKKKDTNQELSAKHK